MWILQCQTEAFELLQPNQIDNVSFLYKQSLTQDIHWSCMEWEEGKKGWRKKKERKEKVRKRKQIVTEDRSNWSLGKWQGESVGTVTEWDRERRKEKKESQKRWRNGKEQKNIYLIFIFWNNGLFQENRYMEYHVRNRSI